MHPSSLDALVRAARSHGGAGRQGAPRTAPSRPAPPQAAMEDAALGSSNVAAGKEPAASRRIELIRPQHCPDPLPARPPDHAAWARQHTEPKEGAMDTFVTIAGNLTDDPELRFTPTGTPWPTSGWPSPPGSVRATPGRTATPRSSGSTSGARRPRTSPSR